jgi:hypothetical protein
MMNAENVRHNEEAPDKNDADWCKPRNAQPHA